MNRANGKICRKSRRLNEGLNNLNHLTLHQMLNIY